MNDLDTTPPPEIEIPDFTDPLVQEAIASEDEAYRDRNHVMSGTSEAARDREEVDRGEEPLVEYTEQQGESAPQQGTAVLNVMHNGAPALRVFVCGPAYEP